jgi:hypothetical protein
MPVPVPVEVVYHLREPVAQFAERLVVYPLQPVVGDELTDDGVVGAVLIVKEIPEEAGPYWQAAGLLPL